MRRAVLLAVPLLAAVAILGVVRSGDDEESSPLTIRRVDPEVVTASLRDTWVDAELARDSCFLVERKAGSEWVDTQRVTDVEQGGGPPQPFGPEDSCPTVSRIYQSDFAFEFIGDPLSRGTWRLLYVRTFNGEREVRASAQFQVP